MAFINGNGVFEQKKNRIPAGGTVQKGLSGGGGTAGSSGDGGKTLGKPTGGTTYIGTDGQKRQGVYLDDAGNPDIGVQIDDAINRGLSYQDVERLLNQRYDKISSTPGLEKYANDALSRRAQSYISQGRSDAQIQEVRDYYAQIAAQQEAAKRAAVEQAVGQLEGQKGTVSQSYDDLMRQLYIDRRKAEKNLPQQMAAMGYTGGLTESSALGLQTGYTEALRQGEQQKTTTLSDIERAISDARLSGEISIAEQAAQLAQQGLLSYTDLIRAQQEQGNWEKQFGFQQGQFDWQKTQGAQSQSNYEREMAYQQQQDALKWAYQRDGAAFDRAMAKWQLTGELDEESAAVLGLPAGTRTTDYAYQLAQMAKVKTGTTRTTPKTDPEAERYDALEARLQGGDYSDDVINGLLGMGVPEEALRNAGWPGRQSGGQSAGASGISGGGGSGLSRGGELIYQQIRLTPGLNRFAKLASIQFALNDGTITEADAELLLRYVDAG